MCERLEEMKRIFIDNMHKMTGPISLIMSDSILSSGEQVMKSALPKVLFLSNGFQALHKFSWIEYFWIFVEPRFLDNSCLSWKIFILKYFMNKQSTFIVNYVF